MAVVAPDRLTLDDVLVVDADVHAHEQPEQIAPYVDPSWRRAVENAAKLPERYLNRPGFCPTVPFVLPGESLPVSRGRAREEIVWDADQMRRELDSFSIDLAVIFPDNFLKIPAIPNGAYAASLTRAYHRWLDERWLADDNGLYALLMATPQDPEDTVREIHRYADHPKFAGVYLPVCQAYPLWGHPKYWPIYAAAEEAGLPILLHSVSGQTWSFPFNTEMHTSIATHTASHVFAMMANLMSMLEQGVPVRYPNLQVCFCEAGLTWVPFLRMRLDKEYNENRSVWPYYDDRPSAYIKKMWFATQPVEEPSNPHDLIDLIRIYDGEDTTIYASDWPHHDFDHPKAVFDLPISNEAKRKIMGANALRLMPKIQTPAKYRAAIAGLARH